MTTLSSVVGGGLKPPTSIIVGTPISTPTVPAGINSVAKTGDAKETVLSVTGSGVVSLMFWHTSTTTGRDVTIIVTIDGVEVLNDTQTTTAAVPNALNVAGLLSGTSMCGTETMVFNSSLLVEMTTTTQFASTHLKYKYYET